MIGCISTAQPLESSINPPHKMILVYISDMKDGDELLSKNRSTHCKTPI